MSDPVDLWQGLWTRLLDGVARAEAPARTLALATQRIDGGGAARMVVLRAADRTAHSLTFYTNTGSDKIFELADEPKAQVLLWDASSNFQARLTVTVERASGTDALWDGLSSGARLNYVPHPSPGSTIDAPHVPTVDGPEAFVILTARITSADILDLSKLPHKRAKFDARDGFTGQWVMP